MKMARHDGAAEIDHRSGRAANDSKLEYLRWAQDARAARVAHLEKSGSASEESARKMLRAFDRLIASIARVG